MPRRTLGPGYPGGDNAGSVRKQARSPQVATRGTTGRWGSARVSGENLFASSRAARENERVNSEEPTSATDTKLSSGQAATPHPDTAGVIAPPPLIYLGTLGLGFGLDAVAGGASLPSRVARPVGAALIVAGAGLIGTFVRAFGRARTPIDPYSPSEAIVTDGPYRLTRNPGYLGMALTYAGIAIASNAPWALVPLPVAISVIDRGVVAREERYLERKFGAQYTDYKRRVRRWI
jgi:protein-S-isoprenylcysteine O-methyltransferase Ste14